MGAAIASPVAMKGGGRAFETSPVGGFGEVSTAPTTVKTVGKQPTRRTGTDCAINYLSLGVAAQLPSNGAGRGGARNKADRATDSLSAAHVGNLIAAAGHSSAIGLPFTRMITIHWEAAGVPLDVMAAATGQFIDLVTKALARHGSRTAWLWVHENGPNKGGHCRLLAHVPSGHVKRLTGLQKGWLRRINGKPYRKRVIHSGPIGGRLGLEVGNPELHAVNHAAALGYVLKGACPDAVSQFGLELVEPGGRIIGKRCGTSQNIGAKARKLGVSECLRALKAKALRDDEGVSLREEIEALVMPKAA